MRIAIVSDYFLDYVGGAQTSMLQQQLALSAAGHHVVMVSGARGRGPRFRKAPDGLKVHPIVTIPGIELPVIPNNKHSTDSLERFFREEAIEIVHVETEFGLAHAAATAAARLGIPVVHTVHTFYWVSVGGWQTPLAAVMRAILAHLTGASIPRLPLAGPAVDNLLRNTTLLMARQADVVVSPSAHQAADLEAAGVAVPIVVVSNPVASSPRPPVPLTDAAAQHPSFLWVARCEGIKRPLVFAQAAIDALKRTGGAFTVHFVGDGTELAALRRLTADHPQIRVHGSLAHEAVLDLMDAASAVALTSLGFDNQPMTIAEAVSRERGVLYCDPRLSEGLGHAGYLAATPDAAGLADALVTLVTEPGLLVQLSRGAARDHALFSAETYVAKILEVYRAALASAR